MIDYEALERAYNDARKAERQFRNMRSTSITILTQSEDHYTLT